MPGCFVDHFVHVLGEQKLHVDESATAGRLLSGADDLAYAGFRFHHVCGPDTSAYDLARDAVAKLAEAGALGRVDAIVYATSLPLNANVGDEAEWRRTHDVKFLMDFPASRLQTEFGLDDAVVFGLDQQACTGMLGSVRLAAALLLAEPPWRRVLCVSADRFPDGALYEQAYNLVSDGAAACVVDRDEGRFRYVAGHQLTNGALSVASDDETVGMYFGYVHRLVTEGLAKAGLTAADVDWVVPQNMNDKAWRVLARLLGVDIERVWFPSMPDAGHVISADAAINLEQLAASGRVESGDHVLLVMAGYGLNWQCTVLEAR